MPLLGNEFFLCIQITRIKSCNGKTHQMLFTNDYLFTVFHFPEKIAMNTKFIVRDTFGLVSVYLWDFIPMPVDCISLEWNVVYLFIFGQVIKILREQATKIQFNTVKSKLLSLSEMLPNSLLISIVVYVCVVVHSFVNVLSMKMYCVSATVPVAIRIWAGVVFLSPLFKWFPTKWMLRIWSLKFLVDPCISLRWMFILENVLCRMIKMGWKSEAERLIAQSTIGVW